MNRLLFSTEDRLNVLLVLFDHLVVEEQQLGGGGGHVHTARGQGSVVWFSGWLFSANITQ